LQEERKTPNNHSAVNRTTERRYVALCEVRSYDADGERSGFVDEEAQLHMGDIFKRVLKAFRAVETAPDQGQPFDFL
jgi:hypothetical protein